VFCVLENSCRFRLSSRLLVPLLWYFVLFRHAASVAPSFLALCLPGGAATEAVPPTVRVHVIPVRDQIGPAAHYVVRRGLKEAIAHRADAVVLDMKTPGGALDSTFEIMEALAKFPGHTLTYVNTGGDFRRGFHRRRHGGNLVRPRGYYRSGGTGFSRRPGCRGDDEAKDRQLFESAHPRRE
jgi:hypothetical protein